VPKPVEETTNTAPLSGTESVNKPCSLVEVPLAVPFNIIETPANGLPDCPSVIFPVIVLSGKGPKGVLAETEIENKQSITNRMQVEGFNINSVIRVMKIRNS
jgi:hypothetical protein